MQKIKGRLKDNWLFALLVGLFILFLVPMVAMCFLAVPASDDFVNASIMRDLMENDSSLLTYFKNVFLQAKDLYDTIQGAFTIDVLIFLNPIAYNIGLYPVTCLLNFIVTLVCVLVLSRQHHETCAAFHVEKHHSAMDAVCLYGHAVRAG